MLQAVSHVSSHRSQLLHWKIVCVITNFRASHITGSKKGTSAYCDNVRENAVYYTSNMLLISVDGLSDLAFLLSTAINQW